MDAFAVLLIGNRFVLFISVKFWKDRLETAQKQDTLVLLENLDPSWTSSEVEVNFCTKNVNFSIVECTVICFAAT